ncbi:MAG: MFS transporter [Candidatus Bathyarchaeia archaeon]|nr:MFS transporter [Candidatus Bathyarchaeia archaeon]
MNTIIRNKGFMYLLIGQGLSELGDWVPFVAFNFLIYNMTGSGFLVTGIFIAKTVSNLVFTPLLGTYIDVWNRKKIMVFCNILRGGLVLTTPFVMTLPALSQSYTLAYLYFVIAAVEATSMLYSLAQSAFIPDIVPKGSLINANSLLSMGSDAIFILGPLIAGVASIFMDVRNAIIFGSFLIFLSGAIISLIATPTSKPSENEADAHSFKEDFLEGFRFMKKKKTVMLIAIISLIIMMGGGAVNALFFVYIEEILRAGTFGYGLLNASLGVGFLVGSMLMNFVGKRLRLDIVFMTGVFLMALAPILWGEITAVSFVILVAVMNGIGNNLFSIARQTVVQTVVQNELRGRVFTLIQFVVSISSIISMGLAGWLSDTGIGVKGIFIIVGLFELVALLPCVLLSINFSKKARMLGSKLMRVSFIFGCVVLGSQLSSSS